MYMHTHTAFIASAGARNSRLDNSEKKAKDLRKHSRYRKNNSLGFIEDVYRW